MEQLLSSRTGISIGQIRAVIKLINEGATLPFMARYRKEATGGLDEVALEKIEIEHKKLLDLEKRKEAILSRLAELQVTNPALISNINNCFDQTELEDLYLPYKQKRKTRATLAKELGLEPLAKIIMAQRQNDIIHQAHRFARKDLTVDEVLQGARDIIAEWVSESVAARNQVRRTFRTTAVLHSKVNKKKKADALNYQDYFDFKQPFRKLPSHRLLAILRAEKEGLIKVKIDIDSDDALKQLHRIFIRSNAEAAHQIEMAVMDGFKRLLLPSIETEMRSEAKEKADDEAIRIFSNNVQQLLLAPPLGTKNILAIDPGFRSGCKMVALNAQGSIVKHTVIYPHPPQNHANEAAKTLVDWAKKYEIDAVAVGNGTAGRETEQFVKESLSKQPHIEVYSVNEAGASIYSASEVAREEFPELDLTVRGSISIGRRLMDPLAELVKIDPKNIGVGQYQHDVAQDKLKMSLNNTVSFTVNKVGANVNTASPHLLQYISGVGPKLAQNIVDYRKSNGPFKDRKALLKVKGFGAKSYEQAAGFLRIPHGTNPLDASAVHPESYHVVEQMAVQVGGKVSALIQNEALTKSIRLEDFVDEKIGLPTLNDIIKELNKPGLDPRGAAKTMAFDDSIRTIEDVKVGMILQGKITNLTKFGAFTDIGVKENGLVHVSQITDHYITDPAEYLHLDQEVTVRVMEVDLVRKRIGLSIKNAV